MARKKKTAKTQKSRTRTVGAKRTTKRSHASLQKDEIVSGPLKSSLRMDPRSSQFMAFSATGEKAPIQDKQSGDLEGLETDEREGMESVAELADEGQDLEAEELEAIENAPDPDQSEVRTPNIPNRSGPQKFKNRNRL